MVVFFIENDILIFVARISSIPWCPMNIHKYILSVVTLLFTGFTFALNAFGESDIFGTHIKVLNISSTESRYLTGDFNGDGIEDKLYLISLEKNTKISKGVKTLNPWSKKNSSPGSRSLALGISHGGNTAHTAFNFIIYDPDYFSTPIWRQTHTFPISLVKKNSKEYSTWKTSVPALPGDAIVLGTEAGIDILLYWSGITYVVFWPDEEP